MFHSYPYTDFHELNLDWFLVEFKKLLAEWGATKQQIQEFEESVDAKLAEMKTTVDNIYDTVFDIVENTIREIFGDDIAAAVKEWLDDHPEATTTVQDNSITFQKLYPELREYILNKSPVAGTSQQIYVSNTIGSDENDGLTPETPFKTLDKAWSQFNVGTYAQCNIVLMDNATYNCSYRVTWSGAPHIINYNDSTPTVNFTSAGGVGARFYSCHCNFTNITISADFGGIYFEGCCLTLQNITFNCAVNFLGCTLSTGNITVNCNSTPFNNNCAVLFTRSVGSADNYTVNIGFNGIAIYATRNSDITLGNGVTINNTMETEITSPMIRFDYSVLRTNAIPTQTGYAELLRASESILMLTAGAYDAYDPTLNVVNCIINNGISNIEKFRDFHPYRPTPVPLIGDMTGQIGYNKNMCVISMKITTNTDIQANKNTLIFAEGSLPAPSSSHLNYATGFVLGIGVCGIYVNPSGNLVVRSITNIPTGSEIWINMTYLL